LHFFCGTDFFSEQGIRKFPIPHIANFCIYNVISRNFKLLCSDMIARIDKKRKASSLDKAEMLK